MLNVTKQYMAFAMTLIFITCIFGCSKDEDLTDHTIDDIIATFDKHGFEIGRVRKKVAGLIGAQDDYGVIIDGYNIGVYKYNISDRSARSILEDAENNGYISGFGIFACKVRSPFLLAGHDAHPNGGKIVDIFLNDKIVHATHSFTTSSSRGVGMKAGSGDLRNVSTSDEQESVNDEHEHIRWRTDFTASTEEAKAKGKPALVFFTAEWSDACQRLKSQVLRQPEVAAAVGQRSVPIKVDLTNAGENENRLAQRFGVRGIPTLILLSSSGDPIQRAVGTITPRQLTGQWLKARKLDSE